jgi:hypothetical protein
VRYTAVDLSTDHQASHPSELERLKREHPGMDALNFTCYWFKSITGLGVLILGEERTVVMNPGRTPRVLGGLMPSRAFGDGKVECYELHVNKFTDSKICSTNGRWRQVEK